MAELEYPSGHWTGFYNYGRGSRPHPMDLILNFSGGRISGDGHDEVGGFVVAGGYDGGGECQWIKGYVGMHTVDYRGFREGKGIWGIWSIQSDGTGGFHIWPLGAEDREKEAAESTEQKLPAEIITTGPMNYRAGRSAFPDYSEP
jgi:hypothetical protein